MFKVFLSLLVSSTFITSLAGGSVVAAKPATGKPSQPTLGNDISWPQCGKSLPSGQTFGIVGVNGGLANNTNACMTAELLWAAQSTGPTLQSKMQLYVNTANPGSGATSWPTNNIDPSGSPTLNKYGACEGSNSLACAWQYGWNRAVEDVQSRFIPATFLTSLPNNPADYPWWLDVETTNSWQSGSTFANQSNVADLEGMTSYLNSLGVTVGLYSTSYQLKQIAGSSISSSSNLNQLASWLPGARSSKAAQSNCSLAPLTASGHVTLTQFVSGSYDYDYSCL